MYKNESWISSSGILLRITTNDRVYRLNVRAGQAFHYDEFDSHVEAIKAAEAIMIALSGVPE